MGDCKSIVNALYARNEGIYTVKVRKSNWELMRIVAMLMIVAGHFLDKVDFFYMPQESIIGLQHLQDQQHELLLICS